MFVRVSPLQNIQEVAQQLRQPGRRFKGDGGQGLAATAIQVQQSRARACSDRHEGTTAECKGLRLPAGQAVPLFVGDSEARNPLSSSTPAYQLGIGAQLLGCGRLAIVNSRGTMCCLPAHTTHLCPWPPVAPR